MNDRGRGRAHPLFLVLLLSTLVLSACSGEDTEDPEQRGQEDVHLPVTWETPTDPEGTSVTLDRAHWITDSAYVRVGADHAVALDLATGDQLWRKDFPQRMQVCDTTQDANPRGMGAMLVGVDGCNQLLVLDTNDGKVLWRRALGAEEAEGKPTINAKAVTVDIRCGAIRRFAVQGGKELPAPLTPDRKCAHESSHTSDLLALHRDPETEDTPDDHGTGMIPPHDSSGWFELRRADNDRLLWKRPVDGDVTLHRLVSTDPVTLETTERGQRLLRVVDDRGRPVHTVGKALSLMAGMDVTDVHDGQLLATYPARQESSTVPPRIHAYDLATGKESWTWQPAVNSQVLGVQGDGLLILERLDVESETGSEPQLWLTRRSLEDPEEAQALGRLPDHVDQNSFAWDDERLILRSGESTVGIDLPDDGLADELPTNVSAQEPEWDEGEVEPADAVDSCEDVKPATLRRLGIRIAAGPPPAGCSWREDRRPDHVEREIAVDVAVASPEDKSATEEAKAAFEESLHQNDDLADARPVQGIGDEAVINEWSGGVGTSARVVLAVRWRNVVATFRSDVSALDPGKGSWVPAVHQLEDATITAASEVLGPLGMDPPDPQARKGRGGAARVADLCTLLQPDGAELVPGTVPLDATPRTATDRRASRCVWDDDSDQGSNLSVRAYAAPAGVATAAAARAKAMFAATTAPEDDSVPGLGDEASLDTFEHDGGRFRSLDLTVRKGNLLVRVDLSKHGYPSTEQMRADLERIARKALGAN